MRSSLGFRLFFDCVCDCFLLLTLVYFGALAVSVRRGSGIYWQAAQGRGCWERHRRQRYHWSSCGSGRKHLGLTLALLAAQATLAAGGAQLVLSSFVCWVFVSGVDGPFQMCTYDFSRSDCLRLGLSYRVCVLIASPSLQAKG